MKDYKFLIKRLWLPVTMGLIGLMACQQPAKEATAPAISGEPLKFGYLICNSKPETIERFAAASAYLSEKMGRKIIMIPMHTYEVAETIAKQGIKYFKVNSLVYIQLKHKLDINILCGEKRGPGGRFTKGNIVVRKNSGIKTIKDLKGKKFSFGPQFAPFGYLVQYDLMLKAGFDPEKDLNYYSIPWGAYKHEKAIYAALGQMGTFDAAAAPELDVLLMTDQGKIKMGEQFPKEEWDFEVIAESEMAPYCTIACTKDADPQIAAQLKAALIGLKDSDVGHMSSDRCEVVSTIDVAPGSTPDAVNITDIASALMGDVLTWNNERRTIIRVETTGVAKLVLDRPLPAAPKEGETIDLSVGWDKGGYLRTGEVLNVTKAGMITGYEEAKDSDYDGLREMAKRVGMDPYPRFE